MSPPNTRTRPKQAVKIILGIALLAALLMMVDHVALWGAVKRSDLPLLLTSFLLFSTQGLFEAARLRAVFADYAISYLDSSRLFLVGLFFSNFAPGLIGADLYQVQHIHSIRPGLLKPISLSLLLRISGVLINLLLALVVIASGASMAAEAIHLGGVSAGVPPWLLPAALAAAVLLALGLASPWGRSRIGGWKARLSHASSECLEAIGNLSPARFVAIVVLGVGVVASRTVGLYLLVLALGNPVGNADVLLAVTVTALALVIPISFAGLGVREVSLAAVLTAAGMTMPEAVAASLISRCFIWILSLMGGIWFTVRRTSSQDIERPSPG